MQKITIRDEKRRAHFNEILEEWCQVIAKYTNEYCPEDALYWHNERATLSSFSVAAGRQNFHVLEEYKADKKGEDRSKRYTGRADLFLAKGRTEYIIEAKQVSFSISKQSGSPVKKITKSLSQARKDAASSNIDGGPVYGLVFAVPYIPKLFMDDQDDLIKEFIVSLKEIDYDAMAYVFPEKAETRTKSGTFFPGVVCVIRAPRRES